MALFRFGYSLRSLVVPAAFLLSGLCNAMAQDNSTVATAPEAALPMPSTAIEKQSTDWRNEIGTFKIGLVRGWSTDMSRLAMTRVESTFSKALGIPVKIVVFERFTSLMDAQADGRIDLAAYSARAFATIRLMCECVDALAAPTTIAGDTGQIAAIAGDNAKIAGFTTMTAVKLGRVANAPIASKDMVRGSLSIGGKAVTGDEPFWVEFTDYTSLVSAYQNNQIDGFVLAAAATFEGRLNAGAEELGQIETLAGGAARPATIVWRSSFWPYGPVAVRNNLASDAKTILAGLFEQMDVTAPLVHATLSEGLAGPFRKPESAGFSSVSAAIRTLVSQNASWR